MLHGSTIRGTVTLAAVMASTWLAGSIASGTDQLVKIAPAHAGIGGPRNAASCFRALEELGVRYQRVERPGIAIAVRVRGDLGGVTYRGYRKKPLVLDCSLVVSLAVAGRYMAQHGIERATYSSSYQRRKVRGTDRWSKHAFGLALDVHVFAGSAAGQLSVKDDYERGLGDDADCIGQPKTSAGTVLRQLTCQFLGSDLFRMVLTPDTDAAHHNHFHLEAKPWSERTDDPIEAGC
ncbi:MAG: extensin family protein [Proteobacteria bacterium]|nr:extensin family protein [Pseudomonadota bacterium]